MKDTGAHDFKDANEEQWYALVDEEIAAFGADLSDVEEMKAGVRKMMPLFQSELEGFHKQLNMINGNTYGACQQMDKRLKKLEEDFSWLNAVPEKYRDIIHSFLGKDA